MPLPKLIDVENFFADAAFSGASISPDGTKIAYLAPSCPTTFRLIERHFAEHLGGRSKERLS